MILLAKAQLAEQHKMAFKLYNILSSQGMTPSPGMLH
jgi:hypothetical protein